MLSLLPPKPEIKQQKFVFSALSEELLKQEAYIKQQAINKRTLKERQKKELADRLERQRQFELEQERER